MSERIKQDKQSVIEAVISGDADHLWRSLKRLTESCPRSFLHYTAELISTEQAKSYCSLGIGIHAQTPPFYFADGVVYGATYTQGAFFSKDAHRAGKGIALDIVAGIVAKARAEHDEAVLKLVRALKDHLAELNCQLQGHSSRDDTLVALGKVDLLKGQALLLSALQVPRCCRDSSEDGDLRAAIDAWR